MRSASDLIAELNAVDESSTIEAKECSQVGKSVMETVCAYSNEPGLGGGYLLLGVEEVADGLFDAGYAACGIADPDKVQSDFVSQCASLFNRPIRPEVKVEKLGDKTVIVAFISESSATDKPVYFTKQGLPQGAYRRIGPTDQQCSEDDLITLYSEHQAETYDTTIISDGSFSDIDLDILHEYRALRAKVNPEAVELSWSDEEMLLAFGCLRDDGGSLKPTVAGVLLFGTPFSLRRCFPMMRIDYIRVPGKKWVEDPDHRFDTIEIRSPMITAIRRATAAILDDIPKSFSLPSGGIQSMESPLLPDRVIREAVVNAVMHRSYRLHGPIQIIRYSNRIEIRNPGHSLKAQEQLGQPGSEPRNPRIAAVLHEVNIAETKGSGIKVMRRLMQESNLTPPTIRSSRQPDEFEVRFLFHHFLSSDDIEWLAGLTDQKLSDEEARALVFVREVGAINNATYREINQAETLDASSHLRRLRDLGLLDKKGSGNRTYYTPGAQFTLIPMDEAGAQSRKPEGQSRKETAQSRKPDASLTTKEMPLGLAQKVGRLSRRPKEQDLREVITSLCAWKAMTSSELAEHLSRERGALLRDHIRPMVVDGLLAYTIPGMPQHPDQAYISPSKESE
tara:strand:- start:1651 stop:3510 length:1860 start_codon:yes stop_codon:yes gene_type:complete